MSQTNLSRCDLNLLVVFDAVARTRSVTGAAEELSLSQPAVSHALKRLRAMLNDPLFVRGRMGLVLTPRARECTRPVADILHAAGVLLSQAAFDPTTTARRFRVAASDYSMITIVPAVVAELRRTAPGVLLEVLQFGADTFESLEDGATDLFFWGSTPPGKPLETAELFQDRLVGLISENHALANKARRRRLTLKDYLAFPHVVVTFPNSRLSAIDKALAARKLHREVGLVTPSFTANIAALQVSDLIMSLPARLAHAMKSRRLIEFEIPLDVPHTPYSLVWHQRTSADPAMNWLRSVIFKQATRSAVDQPNSDRR